MFDQEIRLVPAFNKQNAQLEVSFCYPGSYEIGMAGLGFQLVWWLMEQDEDVLVRRCFLDVCEPGSYSNKSDLYGFTLSWELDIINVIHMLDSYGINRTVEQRGDDDPLIFGGGPVLSANPEPYANVFDVILLGDAEVTVPEFISTCKRISGMNRAEKLKTLAKVEGLYVPSLYEVEYESGDGSIKAITPKNDQVSNSISKQTFKAPDGYVAKTCILSPDTTWGATYLMEVVRSCPQECRFCLASFLTRPFRFVSVDAIVEQALAVSKYTDKIGLLGPSITEHPHFDQIADRLAKIDNMRVNIASVRADTLSETLTRNISKLGQKSVTIALESGSQRLRDIMKKNLSEEQIYAAVSAIESGGLSGVKFYGIAGLPFEVDQDLDETVRLLTDLKRKHSQLKFVFGLSSFVPKAQTPYQWKGRDRKSKKKMEFLRSRLARKGIDVRLESHNWSDIQALLSRGDRRLFDTIGKVSDIGSKVGNWKRAHRANQESSPSFDYFVFDDYDTDHFFPWKHLVEAEKSLFLEKHLNQASQIAIRD